MPSFVLGLLILGLLAACAPAGLPAAEPSPAACPTLTPVAVVFRQLVLPGPMPRTPPPADPGNPDAGAFIDLQPPPAWLLAGQTASLATTGSNDVYRCGVLAHADAVPPGEMSDLATALLPAGESGLVVIGSAVISDFQARIQPWADVAAAQSFDPASGRPLQAEPKLEGAVTSYTLAPAGDEGDQLLAVTITYDRTEAWPSGSTATYLWRLNPQN